MKNYFQLFIFFIVFLNGCNIYSSSKTSSIQVKPINSPTITITQIPSKVSIGTILPTISAIKTEMSSKELLFEFLNNNDNCLLPCLLGITPSQSTYQEAKLILESFRNLSSMTYFDSDIGTVSPQIILDNQVIDMVFTYIIKNTIVSHVHLSAQDLIPIKIKDSSGFMNVYNSKDFGKIFVYFMLSHILSIYGQPSSIFISTYAEIPPQSYGQGHFEILLFYPLQGMLIHYITEMKVIDKNVIGCLTDPQFEIDVYPPSDESSFVSLISPQWKERLEPYQSIEKVTSMKIIDFYQTFLNNTDQCIATSAYYWPTPQPGGG